MTSLNLISLIFHFKNHDQSPSFLGVLVGRFFHPILSCPASILIGLSVDLLLVIGSKSFKTIIFQVDGNLTLVT